MALMPVTARWWGFEGVMKRGKGKGGGVRKRTAE
jgi:hypothetical protein